MKYLLNGENIVKSFGNASIVIDDVSVKIEKGEFVSIMGPSGSGKSTLLFALSGLDQVDRGVIQFDGVDLQSLSEKELANLRRREMGFVFQQPTLLQNLNILDNIIFPAFRDAQQNRSKLVEKATQLMERVGISDLAHRNVSEVSGGQLQRAGICRALMSDPKLIFADEPTGALNSAASKGIMELLEEIHKDGTGILLVTHDAKIAARSQRVLFMSDGKLVDEVNLPFHQAEKTDRILSVMEHHGI